MTTTGRSGEKTGAPRAKPTRRRLVDASTGGAPARTRELRRQGRETLKRLLEAGLVVFDERGYNGARVDDIVKQAKTSHGTFYLYFSNKEDLFQALISGVTEEMRQLADDLPAVTPDRQGYRDLRDWIGRFYDLYSHYHPVIRAWTEMNAISSDLARTGAHVLRRFIDQLVKRIHEIDPLPVVDPEAAALAIVSMIERATFYAVVRMVKVSRDDLVDNMGAILHAGLFGADQHLA